jgi:hypothetical protein
LVTKKQHARSIIKYVSLLLPDYLTHYLTEFFKEDMQSRYRIADVKKMVPKIAKVLLRRVFKEKNKLEEKELFSRVQSATGLSLGYDKTKGAVSTAKKNLKIPTAVDDLE